MEGETWHSAKQVPDIITVSRFLITQSFAIDKNGAFIIDLKQHQRDLLFVNAHTPSGGNNDSRQKEIDNFMAFIRDAKKDGQLKSCPFYKNCNSTHYTHPQDK